MLCNCDVCPASHMTRHRRKCWLRYFCQESPGGQTAVPHTRVLSLQAPTVGAQPGSVDSQHRQHMGVLPGEARNPKGRAEEKIQYGHRRL